MTIARIMRVLSYFRCFGFAVAIGGLLMSLINGCGSSRSSRVAMPDVDPRSAAAAAIKSYDKDGDGRLNESELVSCPAINSARAHFDTDGDRQVSEQEIAQRLAQIYSAGVGVMEVRCTVMRGGRPLSGATVRFVPEPFLSQWIQPAAGTTDSSGAVTPTVAAEQLPDSLRNVSLMQAGLYRVEIEHPSIVSAAAKPLGFEADPTSREGNIAQFNL
jgi:hypothetical protein